MAFSKPVLKIGFLSLLFASHAAAWAATLYREDSCESVPVYNLIEEGEIGCTNLQHGATGVEVENMGPCIILLFADEGDCESFFPEDFLREQDEEDEDGNTKCNPWPDEWRWFRVEC